MDDFRILENLFEKHDDEIHFDLFKESNIIAHNNNNQGNFNKEINFNTQSLASQIINYKDTYILLEIQVAVPYERQDQGKKSIPQLLYLKKSYEIVNSLKISLNNVIISNEVNLNRSSLVNYILNNSKNDYTDYRNLEINDSSAEDLTIKYNPFISKETYVRNSDIAEDDDISDKFHYVNFKIPIFLKDISDFFKKVDLLKFAEFNIDISFIDKIIISKRDNIKTTIKSCYLYVEEVKLSDEDHIRYLKLLNNGYMKTINFLENHTRIFDDKMTTINENFYINNVRNADSVYIYGILDSNKQGFHFDLPSVKFENIYLNIDNVRFENPITNDISAYKILKSKSNHSDKFLISYENFREYYRVYCFNVSRNIRDNHNNKFMNIITNIEESAITAYVVFKTFSTVKLEYNKSNGLIVYKSQ